LNEINTLTTYIFQVYVITRKFRKETKHENLFFEAKFGGKDGKLGV
jgi:hypothetical protein